LAEGRGARHRARTPHPPMTKTLTTHERRVRTGIASDFLAGYD
jgi:hypothetical protein